VRAKRQKAFDGHAWERSGPHHHVRALPTPHGLV